MSEILPVTIELDGVDKQLRPDNCGVAFFRNSPEKDYLDYWEHTEENTEMHWWVFGRREFLIWMTGVVVLKGDDKILRLADRNNGPFTKQSGGWRPDVRINDTASDWEDEIYTRYETNLIDQEWSAWDE